MAALLRRLLSDWGRLFPRRDRPEAVYAAFKALLQADEKSLLLVAELEEILHGLRPADPSRVRWLCRRLAGAVAVVCDRLAEISPEWKPGLAAALGRIREALDRRLARPDPDTGPPHLLALRGAMDRPDLAGGKAANLARAAFQAGLRVPPALVLTARAFQLFLAASGLRPRLDRLLRQADLSRPEDLAALCARMQSLVLGADLPLEIQAALAEAGRVLAAQGADLAVRSSAVAEDGERSFAGQYASELEVRPGDLEGAYRRILASKYRPRAVTYRLLHGLSDEETPMAVLVMPMVPARTSGVLFDPGPGQDLEVFALAGTGDRLMDGRASPRQMRLSRSAPPDILEDSGGEPARLDPGLLPGLADAALALEKALGRGQEVEWAEDGQGRVFVVQTKAHRPPLRPEAVQNPAGPEDAFAILFTGGLPVSPGIGSGPVVRLENPARATLIPPDCVLVVDHLSPSLCKWVDRAAAVVADSGSPASHFASVAREFGVPVLSGARAAFGILSPGRVVTVDARAGRILDGRAASPAPAGKRRRPLAPGAADLAEDVLALACRLTLTDPQAESFTPRECRSLQDVVRFCHEKAVDGLFAVAEKRGRRSRAARRLRTGLPLSVYVLDLGNGLRESAANSPDLALEDVACAPLLALWQGLSAPGGHWDRGGPPRDWEAFDRISAGLFSRDSALLASHALVSPDYLHFQLRFGYHFAVVNALCAGRSEANFISLRFKGGGGVYEQRLLRVLYLVRVLEGFGFQVRTRGDMLEASHARAGQAETASRLDMLGRLMARTRLMDMDLRTEAQALALAGEFLAECAGPPPGTRP